MSSYKKTKTDLALIEAKSKGYLCDFYGNIYSKNKKLSFSKSVEGRCRFSVRLNGERITVPVHRFVAYLKYGYTLFDNDIEVRHLDGDSLNNSWNNIAIGTHSQNMLDIPEYKRKVSRAKKHFTDEEVLKIKQDKDNGMTYRELCKKYNSTRHTLSYMFNQSVYYKKAIAA